MSNAAMPGQQQRFHQCEIENRGGQMSTSVLYMSMSLDGYIAGPNDEYQATGAVLVGRRTAEQVDHYGGDHHGVPIFVVSHRPPGPSVATYPLVTYVTDGIASAMAQARAAAGDRNVLVHGAYT